MKTRASTDAVTCFLIVSAVVAVLWCVWRPPPTPNRSLHRAIGQALAKESLRLVAPGGQVVLISRDTEAFPQPAFDLLVDAFKRELAHAHVSLASAQLLQTDPIRPLDVPSGDFFETLRRTPAGHVIVSLLGPPLLTSEQRARLGPVKAKVVAFCSGNQGEAIDLRELFGAGLLHSAIVSRINSSAASPPTEPPRRFEELYTTVTPGTITAAEVHP